jgi:endonuclease/exonuclease/phosphatase family metal-dependent hydrolase
MLPCGEKMKRRRLLWMLPLGGLLLYFAVLFVHGWYSDWKPAPLETLEIAGKGTPAPVPDSVLRFAIWNVGFGAQGAESDFFFDDEGMWYSGSSMVRSPRPLVEKNMQAIRQWLGATSADFFLLQEVDVSSDRSYTWPQWADCQAVLPAFSATMALNYQCSRVPIPLLEPWNAYGSVLSGLGTLSRYQPLEAQRHALPGEYPMPDRMFQLDRCVAVHRYRTAKGPELVVMNIHNSAYDPGDRIKAIQLPYLRDLAMREYEKGNYVVIGGDWNQCPPHFRFDQFMPGKSQGIMQGNVPADFFPEDWVFAYDPTVSTNRKLRDPYKKGETFETLIDFYLVSPNVQVLKVRGVGQDYAWSDHQPVLMELRLM